MGEFPLEGSGKVHSLRDSELCFIDPIVNWIYFHSVLNFLTIYDRFRGMIVCFMRRKCVAKFYKWLLANHTASFIIVIIVKAYLTID
jgi:hypothetical protein